MKTRFRSSATSRHRQRGQALVEFALVSVVFLMVIASIFDMARLIESWITVQHAAREGARYAITGQFSCAGYTDDRDECIRAKVRDSTVGLIGGGPSGRDVTVNFMAWDYPSYSAPDPYSGKACDQIEVTVSYVHHFATPIMQTIVPHGVNLHGSQRMTNEPFGQCQPNDGTH